MRHDNISDMFCIMKNSERIGKSECTIPASTLIKNILKLMQKNNYIGKFELVDNGRGGKFQVQLSGRINSCNVIKPRFSVNKDEYIRWEKRFLPANNIGMLILTTSKGVIDQKEAKKAGTGGKLLGYVY